MLHTQFARVAEWVRRDGVLDAGDQDCVRHRPPIEAAILRSIGGAWVIALTVITFTTSPHPGLHDHGRGLIVLLAFVLVLGSSVVALERHSWDQAPGSRPPADNSRRTVGGLVGVLIGSGALALEQPNGVWVAGLYFVAIIAAVTLDRRAGLTMLVLAVAPFTIGALVKGEVDTAVNTSVAIVPWYLILRLMRLLGERNRALETSRAAEAQAAVQAERNRIAREMHDVMAHSLSALALSLESTRLLAHERGVDAEITLAIGRAHGLAATGLDDARRVLAAARGDELPGPERLQALTGAFGEQSGLPVALEVRGEPRELAPDARVAVYRTAQEALTNIRRHATPEQVCVSLDYGAEATVLVIEDQAAPGTPPPTLPGLAGNGYGLTGMRERAQLLGGELMAAPTLSGFRVELRLPG